MKEKRTFGVSLIMSQLDPYYSEQAESWGEYTLFGQFDGLRLEVVEGEAEGFVTGSQDRLSGYDKKEGKRILFQPRVQKQFFYIQEANDEWIKRDRLKEYQAGTGKLFIGIFAIKLHPQHVKYQRCKDDICNCAERRFKAHMRDMRISTDYYECFVMRSLSADDIHILVGMDKPWYGEVLKFSLFLNDWDCRFNCCDNASVENIIDPVVSKLKNLKKATTTHDYTVQELWTANINDKEQYIIDWIIKERETLKTKTGEELAAIVESCTRALYSRWESAIKSVPRTEHKKLEWLLDCINHIRLLGPVPVVLQTYSIVGFSKDLYGRHIEDEIDNGKYVLEKVAKPEKICRNDDKPSSACLHRKYHVNGYEKIKLDFRVALRPGTLINFPKVFKDGIRDTAALVDKCFAKLITEPSPPDAMELFPGGFDLRPLCKNNDITMSAGRYDYVWQAELTPAVLIFIYTQYFCKWRRSNSPITVIQAGCGSISLSSPYELKEKMPDYMKECIELNHCWAEEQHESVRGLFAVYSFSDEEIEDKEGLEALAEANKATPDFEKLIKRVIKDPDLQDLIKKVNKDRNLKQLLNQLSLLHVQGCHSFYQGAPLREFDDVRRFFVSFYHQLTEIFLEDLPSKKYKDFSDEILSDIKSGLNIGIRCFTELFNDRMVIDMTMRENTLIGGYAVGAYEDLVVSYSKWMNYIFELLTGAEQKSKYDKNVYAPVKKLGFTLMPVENDTPHSFTLFPLRFKGEGRLTVYEISLEEMLLYNISFPTIAHEMGHYFGILNRKHRVETALKVAAFLFAKRMSYELRNCSSRNFRIGATINAEMNVQKALADYLIKEANYDEYPFIHHVEYYCKVAFDKFLQEALVMPTSDEMRALLKALASLYESAGALPLIRNDGYMFNGLIKSTFFDDALRSTKLIMRECNADIVAVTVLDMKSDKVIEWFLSVIDKERGRFMTQDNNVMIPDFNLYAMRLVAMLLTSLDESSHDNAIRGILPLIGKAIKKAGKNPDNAAFVTGLGTYYDFYSKGLDVNNINTRVWDMIGADIFENSKAMRELLLKENPTKLKRLQEISNIMCDGNPSLEKLAYFLKWGESYEL